MFGSIRYKLMGSYLLLVTLGTGMLTLYVLFSFRSFYLARVREDLEGRAVAVADQVGDALASGRQALLNDLAGTFAAQPHLTFRVFDPQMKLVVSSRMPPPDKPPWNQLPGMSRALRGHAVSGVIPDERPGSEKSYFMMPIEHRGKRVGYLRISLLLEEFNRVFTRVQVGVGLGLLMTLAGCALISLLLAHGLSEPILRMRLFAERVGAGQFGNRLTPQSKDEIGQLAAALNRMCERLDHAEEERRAFLAAVSHELRTPATNIQVTLEALLSGAGEESALRERFLKAALSESERLSQLVRDLVDLARLEAGGVRMAAQPVCVNELVSQAREVLSPRLRDSALQIETWNGLAAWVLGDRDRLLQVLLNLLDNAIKFSRPDCRIRVSIQATAHEVTLVVEDDGPGIPEEDLPFVFERFYTVDRSRARGRSGTGLGLAIVRQIVEAHHGQVEAGSAPGRGARFTVRLPRAPHPRSDGSSPVQ